MRRYLNSCLSRRQTEFLVLEMVGLQTDGLARSLAVSLYQEQELTSSRWRFSYLFYESTSHNLMFCIIIIINFINYLARHDRHL